MPELPEVETTRRGIDPHVCGQTISAIDVRNPSLRWPIDIHALNKLCGHKISHTSRRSKYLIIHTQSISQGNKTGTEQSGGLIIHLGMSGRLKIVEPETAIEKHDHFDLCLSNNLILRYTDPRRFGAILSFEGEVSHHQLLQKLGPEPLSDDFLFEPFYLAARQKRQPIKQYIMDNHNVVGVGNIYANEALFMSGIRPGRAAMRVTKKEFKLLYDSIKEVLAKAIEQGGTTLKDFLGGDGKPGYFQLYLAVYGRAGDKCDQCQSLIKEKRIGQRNSFYCPKCQS